MDFQTSSQTKHHPRQKTSYKDKPYEYSNYPQLAQPSQPKDTTPKKANEIYAPIQLNPTLKSRRMTPPSRNTINMKIPQVP